MAYRFVDCNGLGGAFALGMAQNGFELAHKCGSLNLGIDMAWSNRALLGWNWEYEFKGEPEDWYAPDDVAVVIGNPPCSGFSSMTRKDLRGVDAAVNQHIENFGRYVGKAKPLIAAFESVQVTQRQGTELLHRVWRQIERDSGRRYALHHLMHNALSVGGPANRPRYFCVFSQIPFGVEYPEPDGIPTFRDVCGDLQGLAQTWQKQPYRRPPSWWSARRRSADGAVDGHAVRGKTEWDRVRTLLEAGEWRQGELQQDFVRRLAERDGVLPGWWESQHERLRGRGYQMGVNQVSRWRNDRPCRVITGAALQVTVHPTEDRLITYREAARIQGFPDDWRLLGVRDVASLHRAFGKGIPVDAGRWFGYWAKRALDGDPGTMEGVPVGEREYLINADKGFKRALERGGRRRHEFWPAAV